MGVLLFFSFLLGGMDMPTTHGCFFPGGNQCQIGVTPEAAVEGVRRDLHLGSGRKLTLALMQAAQDMAEGDSDPDGLPPHAFCFEPPEMFPTTRRGEEGRPSRRH